MPRFASMVLVAVLVLGCAPEESVLRAGAAAVVITPTVEPFEDLNGNRRWDPGEPFEDLNGDGVYTPVWLGGFGNERSALGVHDDIWARVLVLDKAGKRIGIASLDWVGLMHDHCLEFAQAAGLELDQLVVTSTHNHQSPDTMGIWGPAPKTGRDEEYIAWARERTVAALARAVDGLTPVRVWGGVGRTEGLTNDSRLPIVKHEQVTALRFDRLDGGGPLAAVVHWSNHPEVLGASRLISADFPDSLVAALEEVMPGAVGIYWQGIIGGLLNPMTVDVYDQQGHRLPDYSFEKSERLGRLVAEVALQALEDGRQVAGPGGRLEFRRRFFLVPVQNIGIAMAALAGIIRRTPYDEHGRAREVGETLTIDLHIRTQVTVMDLGEVQIATVPGEFYPELAVLGPNGEALTQDPQDPGADFYGTPCEEPIYRFMRDTPFRVVMGLANDEVGYIIPKCQWDQEEPYTYGRSEAPYGESVSVGPEMAPILNRVLAEEFATLNER